jgi:hypothetical protein
MTETKQEEKDILNNMLLETIIKTLKKLKVEVIYTLANELDIKVIKGKPAPKPDIKPKKRNKADIVNDIEKKIKTLSSQELLDIIKKTKVGIELEVRNILDKDINITSITTLDICLTLDKFFQENPKLKSLFTNTCDLVNINNTIKSSNCTPLEVQGLYILTIAKQGVDYIVKLGSFAESQGMSKRITSFGGGNYETGSATNKWFQKFIKKALEQGYTAKFTYYNRIQEKIKVDNLDGDKIEITPYVIRPLETELFKKYNASNHNIPPIFGSNCL